MWILHRMWTMVFEMLIDPIITIWLFSIVYAAYLASVSTLKKVIEWAKKEAKGRRALQ